MRYLGGKTQIAKDLVSAIPQDGRYFWDAFCGSLAISCALSGPGMVSDTSAPLIALYQAIDAGWDPPATLTKEEWQAAKALPDSNPLKGFAGFGCSFRGLYFSGYAGGYVGPVSNPGAQAARQVLTRDVRKLAARGCCFKQIDFLSVEPEPGLLLYLDPPYRNTSAYAGTAPFDHDRFYGRVEAWARYGPVYVSEYDFPLGRVVWERSRAVKLKAGTGARAVEKLYRVG